jgi:hypothetical protein
VQFLVKELKLVAKMHGEHNVQFAMIFVFTVAVTSRGFIQSSRAVQHLKSDHKSLVPARYALTSLPFVQLHVLTALLTRKVKL